MLLEDFLQMPVAPAGRVGELGRALLDQELALRPGVVLLGEDPLELAEHLVLLARHALPALLEPVDRVALQARDDGLEAAEVLEYPELLRDVDPGLDDARALLRLRALVHEEDRGDDAQRDRVELVHGGENRGGVGAARAVAAPRPDRPEALVGDELAEDLGVHARELLGEVPVRHLRERVVRPVVAERVVAAVQAHATIVVYGTGIICNTCNSDLDFILAKQISNQFKKYKLFS